jgi:hypothetical protein
LLRWTQFARRAQLALADHMHEFDAGKGCRSRPEGFEPQANFSLAQLPNSIAISTSSIGGPERVNDFETAGV